MSRSRKLVVHLLLALMFLVAVPSSSAESRDTTTSEIVRGSVEWTLPAGQCPDLPAGLTVSGTGQRFQVITTIEKSDDRTEIIDNDFVTGTAVDSNGDTYNFIYSNQNRQRVPKSGSPIRVNMTDTFILSANEDASDVRSEDEGATVLSVGFVWRWTYNPDKEEIWPPEHNWRKEITIGDPLLCDPI